MRPTSSEPGPPPRRRPRLAAGLLALAAASPAAAQSASDILNTRHNLSVSGPGPVRALTETRVCIFCHTPHNATPLSPLWNKELEPQAYTVYASPTMRAGPLPQPTGPTKLCLSCHDGTIAMGAVVNPAGGIGMEGGGTLPAGGLSDFGLGLSGHHPVSFSYQDSLPNPELASTPPTDLTFGGADEIHCVTCHDPHDDRYGRFLVKENRFSALCIECHQIPGWSASAHATSTESVAGNLPRPPKTWPTWTQLNEWGCETCHTPHFAPTPEQLLNFTADPPAPFSCTTAGCHTSDPPPGHLAGRLPSAGAAAGVAEPGRTPTGAADIARQSRKVSGHREQPGVLASAKGRTSGLMRAGIGAVACADCHNPHRMNDRAAAAPYASGRLEGVSGVNRNGARIGAATYEYEVCLKCHGDFNPDIDFVPRVTGGTNARLAFDPSNPSYHPVIGMGKNPNVPSLPSRYEPGMTSSDMIYCTSCHADDEGASRGPHGSDYAPILKRRYETGDNTPESFESYELCYRCHDRSSILSDAGFPKKALGATGSGGGHSGHLAAGAPCSACHDPHGVYDPGGGSSTGSHTHLIDFDARIVTPRAGARHPVFEDTGALSGRCDLVCHGVVHDRAGYP